MTSIHYTLIILPIIVMVLMSFVFQSTVTDLKYQTLRLNCPFPVIHGNVTNLNFNPDGTNIRFDVEFGNPIFANDVTKFSCTKDPITGSLGMSTTFYNSTASFFPSFDNAFAWLGHAQMSLDRFFDRAMALATVIYLLIQAPSQVSAMAWWSYINILLVSFIGLGIFMIIRGGSS